MSILGELTNIVFLMGILPIITQPSVRGKRTISEHNVLIMVVLSTCLAIGAWTYAFAFQPWAIVLAMIPYSVGQACIPISRTLLNSSIRSSSAATLNSMIAIMEQLTIISSAPLLIWSLSLGLQFGGIWIGLPFMFTGVLTTVMCTALMTLYVHTL